MSIGKRGLAKLAAAAVAVAGVLGVTWGQLPNVATGALTVNMTASMVVENVNEIHAEAYPDPLINPYNVAAAPNARNPGNFGKIWVKTTAGRWDIKMSTENGGRMKYTVGSSTRNECVTNWDGSQRCEDVTIGGTNNYLVYGPNSGISGNGVKVGCSGVDDADDCTEGTMTPDTVILDVAIGMAKDGKALGVATGTLYAIDGPATTQQIPAQIEVNDILGSKKDASTTVGEISFAQILGNHYSQKAPNAPTGGAPSFAHGPNGASGKAWSQVASDGFPRPATDQTEYFYINVGISPTNSGKLNTLVNGEYTETFYFDLYAGY
jgi:hypothetical protein